MKKKKRIGFIRLLLKEVSSKTFKKANVQAGIMKDNIFRNSWKFQQQVEPFKIGEQSHSSRKLKENAIIKQQDNKINIRALQMNRFAGQKLRH